MEKVTKEQFEMDLKADKEAEMMQELDLQYRLKNDYEFFMEYYMEDFEEARCKLKRLKDLHHSHNHELDVEWVMDIV